MSKAKKPKAKPLVWLDRSLLTSPYCYSLCLNEMSFHAELKRLKLSSSKWPDFQKNSACGATIHFFENNENNGKCAIIALSETSKKYELEQIYAILVHEAVHLWQEICDDIGEKFPASEQEAYAIQRISQSLMYSYKEQTKK